MNYYIEKYLPRQFIYYKSSKDFILIGYIFNDNPIVFRTDNIYEPFTIFTKSSYNILLDFIYNINGYDLLYYKLINLYCNNVLQYLNPNNINMKKILDNFIILILNK